MEKRFLSCKIFIFFVFINIFISGKDKNEDIARAKIYELIKKLNKINEVYVSANNLHIFIENDITKNLVNFIGKINYLTANFFDENIKNHKYINDLDYMLKKYDFVNYFKKIQNKIINNNEIEYNSVLLEELFKINYFLGLATKIVEEYKDLTDEYDLLKKINNIIIL